MPRADLTSKRSRANSEIEFVEKIVAKRNRGLTRNRMTRFSCVHAFAFASVLAITPLVLRTREYTDKSIDFQVSIKLIVWGICTLLLISSRATAKLSLSLEGKIWILWCCSIVATLPFSIAPTMSAAYEFSTIICVLYPFAAIAALGEIFIIRIIVVVSGIFCAASLFIYIFVPSIGRITEWTSGFEEVSGRMGGLAGHPNDMGHIAGYTTLLLTMYFDEMRKALRLRIVVSLILISLISLFLTNNRTAMLGLGVSGVLWYVINGGRFRGIGVFIAGTGATVLFAFIGVDGILELISRGGNTTELTSFTGRDQIWPIAWELSLERFWSGWGYGASVLILPSEMSGILGPTANTAPHAHNMFLQLFLSCGVVALLLGICGIVIIIIDSYIARSYRALCLTVFLVVVGVTEPNPFLGAASYDTIILGVIIGIVARDSVVRQRDGSRLMLTRHSSQKVSG